MTVRIYQSTNASAPVLSGTIGSLIAVLDAVLVNGYGSMTAAGWTKVAGTNVATYRAATGNRLYMRIDDTVAQEARVVGYESMTDVNTGTNPFPTTAQQSGGLYLRKSSTADATARPWVIVASATAIYIFIQPTQTNWYNTAAVDGAGHMFFGDLISYNSVTDNFATMLIAPTSTGGGSIGRIGQKAVTQSGTITAATGHFVARAYTQSVGSIAIAKHVPGDYSDALALTFSSVTLPTFPDICSGTIMMANIEILEQGSSCCLIRGKMPGAFSPLHHLPGQHGDIVQGSGAYAGRSWLIVTVHNTTTVGRIAIELTNNW